MEATPGSYHPLKVDKMSFRKQTSLHTLVEILGMDISIESGKIIVLAQMWLVFTQIPICILEAKHLILYITG